MRRVTVLPLLLAGATALDAQTPTRPPLTLVPHGDTVLVYLTERPPALGGFVLYRGRVGQPLERVTAEPVRAVREPGFAAGMMGTDLPAVMRALRTTDEGETLRRLQGDAFAGTLLSLYYRGVATVLGRFHEDAGLTRGAAYEYAVVFTDARGEETDRRFTGRVTLTDAVPGAPTGGKVSAGDHSATLGWQYPKYRGDPRDFVIGFHVYRADGATGEMRRLTTAPVLRDDAAPFTYHDRDVHNDVAYRYQVTAVDMLGVESAPGAAVSLRATDKTPPAIAVGLAVENGDGVVRLVWRMSPEADAAGYHVERSAGLSQPYTRLTRTPVPVDAPEWIDSTVTGGRQYFYRVIAVDAAGNASEPSNALSSLPLDRTPPAPPAGVTATVQGRNAIVRWTASPTRSVLGYHLYRGETVDRMARLTMQPVAALTYVDSGYAAAGLVPGRRYVVRVSAVDSSFNESAPAAAEIVLPDDAPPSAPRAVTARSVLGRYAEIAWVASGALDVEAYVLTRADTGAAALEVARLDAATAVWRDTAVVSGRTYVYALSAVDSAGNRSGALVDTLRYGDETPPAAPRYVTALVVPAGIELIWERVASPDLAGYVLYRSLLPTGQFERVTPAPVVGLRFVDPSGRPEHYYVVRAVDRSHNESRPSPPATGRTP